MAGSRLDHIRNYIRQNGLGHTAHQAWQKVREHYLKSYDRWYRAHEPTHEELERQHQHIFKAPPLISVVVPVFNTRASYLKEMAMSVVEQSYPHWELCLLDGGSVKAETLEMLRELSGTDKRIRVERAKENLGIAGNTNLAINMARGSYVALLDHDDTLTPDALYWVAEAVERTGAELIYSDEDKMHHEGKYYFTPHLKPDYSPDLLKSCNYFCHLMVLKTSLLEKVGGLSYGFDGSQDHQLALKASWAAEGVHHIPKVLYHWRQDANSMSHRNMDKCLDSGKRALEEQLCRENHQGEVQIIQSHNRVTYLPSENSMVSVLLWQNGKEAGLDKLGALLKQQHENIEILSVTGANKAKAFNDAVNKAKGDMLLFIDASVKLPDEDWLKNWLGYCQREECLSVCGKMLDRHSRLACAGYVVGVGEGVVVPQKGLSANGWGYFGVKEMIHNISSSTWALMMVKKDDFLAIGGFDEDLPALADVDWCLRASRDLKGWHTYDPYMKAKTSGSGLWLKPTADWEAFLTKWPDLQDSYYNPQFSRKDGSYRLS